MRFDQLSSQSTQAATLSAIALGFSIPISVALDNVLLAAVLICWLGSAGFDEKLAWLAGNRVAQTALALFVLLVAGIAWSAEPAAGLRLAGKYIDLLFVPIFATLFRAPRERCRAGRFFIAAILLTLLLSYLTWAGLVPQGYPVIGDANEPEVFKKYLTQSILVACGAYYFALLARDAKSKRDRLLWALLAIFAGINVILMLSGRSGQIALAALAVLFAFSVWRSKGLALAGSGLALVAALVILGYAPENGRLNTVVRDFKAWQLGEASNTSTGQRLDYAIHSAAIVRNHPLTGVGTGGFAAAYARQVEGTGIVPTVNPHNEYLNLAVQLGIAGLLTLAALFYVAWRQADRLPTALERDLARGLILTYAIGSLFNSLLMDHVEGLFFAWSLGVLFGGIGAAPSAAATTAEAT
jgi:O-antigen ligase